MVFRCQDPRLMACAITLRPLYSCKTQTLSVLKTSILKTNVIL